MSVARVLVDGAQADTVSVADRGLSYGDGLFETIRFVHGHAPLWLRHMERLHEGCRRLGIPSADAESCLREALAVSVGVEHAVVRITLTRGAGARGYAPPALPTPTRIVAAFDAPAMHGEIYQQGVRVRWCRTRLGLQPLLAGMKHLNRLEQVMARSEWSDASIHEGLLLDLEGRVVCATMANLFVVIDGALATPSVDRCGVAGVARAEVLSVRPDAQVTTLSPDQLQRASEVFLCSSVRGILPVQAVGDTVYGPGPVTRAMQYHWRGLGYPMEQA
jgi:4-amino-4-deoxychorismate lyase